MSEGPISIESLCEGLSIPERVQGFDDIPGGKVIFGCGSVVEVGGEAAELGATRVLVVTDPGLAKTDSVKRVVSSIEAAGLSAVVFDQVHENPTTRDVEQCVIAAGKAEVDLIVGLGGGSSMDTAKGCNFILTNGGEMKDYWGVDKATEPMLPLIAIPTTAGTGSECQSFALIADAESHAKMACGDKKAAAAVAILDPELTITMPLAVTAHTAIDAMAHALETAVCVKRTEISSEYSRAGWLLLDEGLPRVLENPDDLEARARVQLGAAFAGTAIENSMLGIAHSCANPLTAHYNVVHGQAVGTMLPHVISFNSSAPEAAAIYQSLSNGGELEEEVRRHLVSCSMDKSLESLGVERKMLRTLAEEASQQWTAQFNPVAVDAASLEAVYADAFESV